MKKNKRLGRGLEDISHYFVSQNQTVATAHPVVNEELIQNHYKSVSIVDITDPQRGADLCAKVGIWLAQNGIRVLLVDADSRFPGISFMLGMSLPGFSLEHYYQEIYEPSDLVCTGPYGVKLLAPHLTIESVSPESRAEMSLILDTLKSIEQETDVVIIRQFEDYINPITDEALFVVSASDTSLMDSYKALKKFALSDDRKMIGIVMAEERDEENAAVVFDKICNCTEMSYGIKPYFLGNLTIPPFSNGENSFPPLEKGGKGGFETGFTGIVSRLTEISLHNRKLSGRKRLFFERFGLLLNRDCVTPQEMKYLNFY
ncbi:MAG TPA: hypothetical protein VIH39_03645 [Nitrospirota bacterium]